MQFFQKILPALFFVLESDDQTMAAMANQLSLDVFLKLSVIESETNKQEFRRFVDFGICGLE